MNTPTLNMLTEKPKILMLGWEYPPNVYGGLGIACQHLSQAIAPEVALTLITPKKVPAKTNGYIRFLDTEHIRLPEGVESLTVTADLQPYTTELEGENTANLYEQDVWKEVSNFSKQVLQLTAGLEFDLIHAHDWMTFPAALALQTQSQKPLILHVHSTAYDRQGKAEGAVFELEKNALQAADFVIPVSHYTARILRDHYQLSVHKLVPIHNAAELSLSEPLPKAFPEKLVTFAGRLTQQKNPQAFVQLALKVWEQYDQVRFVVAGSGHLQAELVEMVAQHHISHKFHFAGFLDRKALAQVLATSDVFVMPSLSEPFGIVALEAAGLGVPCVISRQAGVLEVLKGPLTADAEDLDLMAEYVLMLLQDERLSQYVVKKQSASIQNHDWHGVGQKVLALYALMLKKRIREVE